MVASNRSKVSTRIKAHRAALQRHSVRSLALFGSAARDRLRKRSDVDITFLAVVHSLQTQIAPLAEQLRKIQCD
jgi:predicted nucleotidyltransferase